MPSAADIRAGKAFFELTIDRDKFDRELKEATADAKRELSAIHSEVSGIAAAKPALGSAFANFNVGKLAADVSLLTAGIRSAANAIAQLRAAAASPISISFAMQGGQSFSGGAMQSQMRMNRFVGTSADSFTSRLGGRTIVTDEGVFQRPRWWQGLLSGGFRERSSAAEFREFAAGLASGKSASELGGSKYLRRLVPTQADLRSIGAFTTGGGGIASRSTVGDSQFDAALRQRFGIGQGGGSPSASSSMTSPQATLAASAQSAVASQLKSVAAMAAPIKQTAIAAQQLTTAARNASSATFGLGMRIGIAGGAMIAAAVPFKLLTDTYSKSAHEVVEYAKAHKVSIEQAIIKTNSQLTASQVKVGEALYGTWSKLRGAASDAWKSIAASVGEALAPELFEKAKSFNGLLTGIKEWGTAAGKFVASNRGIVAGMFSLGTAMAVAGTAIVALGTAVTVVGANLTVLAGVASAVASPWVLLTGAVVAGGYAWVKYTESGKNALATIQAMVGPYVAVVRDSISGISDAIKGGDLSLAWKIGLTGAKLTVAMLMEEMSALLGETTSDAISTIVEQVANGDLAGAWETTVMSMGALWDSFASGIVSTFVDAAGMIIDTWQKTVTSIANSLIDASAGGGPLGKVASFILGTDMEAENARGQQLDERLRAKGLATGMSASDQAKADIAAGVGSTANGMRTFIEGMKRSQQEVAAESSRKLVDRVGGSNSSRAAQLRKDLEELNKDAAGRAAAATIPGIPGVELAGSGSRSSSFITPTFSAAAAMAMGYGPKAADKDKVAKDQLAEARETNRLTRAQAQELKGLKQALDRAANVFRFR